MMKSEVDKLAAHGVDAAAQLGVSPSAHLILPYHRAVEACAEAGPGAIGTTGRGIGFAYRDKAARVGLRVGDLADPAYVASQADRVLHRLRLEFPEAEALAGMTGAGLTADLAELAAWLAPLVTDVSLELHEALRAGRSVLLEGAQGTLLDLDHGTYPFVTSSPASAAGAPLGVGLGPGVVDEVVGVTKAYATRVGHGPFPSEMPAEEAARLREAGEEYGATTGRARRCGWLDLPALRYAARVNGLTQLVVTKLDVLDEFEELQVAVAYEADGRAVEHLPSDARRLERCRPVFRRFAGWRSDTTSARRWSDLPAAAREYLEFIEREVGVPIVTVSVGAARESEVRRG